MHSFYEVSVRPVCFTSEIHRSAVKFGIDALQDCSAIHFKLSGAMSQEAGMNDLLYYPVSLLDL
jgi:hypothetical protein